MSAGKSSQSNSNDNTEQLNLNQLTVPSHICHIKAGSVLCTNEQVVLLQDGPTTIEFCLPPKFQTKKIPWRHGLIRDIAWCADLSLFILVTRDALFNLSPKSLFEQETPLNRPIQNFTVHKYSKVKPYNDKDLFWRCTCVGTTLYIVYWAVTSVISSIRWIFSTLLTALNKQTPCRFSTGLGTVMDEYELKGSSCTLTNRWLTPRTCADYEGIWCIRYHAETDQLGFAIVDSRNNEWRIEIRSRNSLAVLWKLVLPITIGDVELSPIPNREWLAINSVGLRLIEIANQKLKAIVDYNRELRNAIVMDNTYFLIRTRSTLEIQRFKGSK